MKFDLFKNNNKGFTLIELLVVISIIGVLMAIIYPSFNDARKKGRDSRRQTDISLLSSSLRAFADYHGYFPSVAEGTCSSSDSFAAGGCLEVLVTEGFIKELPVDPTSDDTYFYSYDNTCAGVTSVSQYRLWVVGEMNHSATSSGWTDDNTIGATNCSDPS